MNKEQAVVYLRFSGFSEEQIKAIEEAFTCDKCVYSTSEGCQYDDITETIPPFEDCISRQAVLDLVNADWKYEGLEEPINSLPPVSSSEHPSIDEVLDKIRAEIEELAKPNEFGGRGNGKSVRYGLCKALEIIDKYMAEGSKKE